MGFRVRRLSMVKGCVLGFLGYSRIFFVGSVVGVLGLTGTPSGSQVAVEVAWPHGRLFQVHGGDRERSSIKPHKPYKA